MNRCLRWCGVALVGVMVAGAGVGCEESAAVGAEETVEAAVPDNRLAGLYFRMVSYHNGSYFEFHQEHYYFTADGKAYMGVPRGGLENFDWTAAAREKPTITGTYDIADGKLTITWADANKKPTSMPFKRKEEGNVELDGLFTSKVGRFEKDTKLEGTYSWAGSSGGGMVAFVGSARSITFAKDGTYKASAVGSASINAAGQTIAGSSESIDEGTYTISGNTMTLTHKDGSTTHHTVYPFTNIDNQLEINVDGAMMAPSKT